MPFSLEDQLRLLSPQQFEELCAQLIKKEFPNANHVEGASGDEGIDVFEGEIDPIKRARSAAVLRVWQVKRFRNGVKRRQREQVENSLARVLSHQPQFWTLCVQVNLDIDGHRWFQSLAAGHPGITFELWQADEIVRRLLQDSSLVDKYFLHPQSIISANSLQTILDRLDEFESVSALLDAARKSLQAEPKSADDFYNGTVADWRDIVQGFDAPRERFGEVWQVFAERANRVGTRVPLVLISGRTGDGKSTFLMRLAAELCVQGFQLVLYHKDDILTLSAEQLSGLPSSAVAFVFIDKITRFGPDSLRGFLERLHRNAMKVIVVAAGIRSIWEAMGLSLDNVADVREIPLDEMTDEDIEMLLDKLSVNNKYLGQLASLMRDEQRKVLREKATRQMLVALLEAKRNEAFEAYVLTELGQLELRFGVELRRACIYVSAVYRFDLPMPRSILQRLLPRVSIEDELLRRTHGLLTEIVPRAAGIVMRHALVSEVIFSRTITSPEEEVKRYTDLIEVVDVQANEDKFICHVLKGIQDRNKRALASKLLASAAERHPLSVPLLHMCAMDKSDQGFPDEARVLFDNASQIDSANARVWQAWGILEWQQGNIGDERVHEPYTARWLFHKATEADPQDCYNLISWADLEKKSNNWKVAENLYLRAADIAMNRTTLGRIYFDLSMMFSSMRRPDRAIEFLNLSVSANPDDPLANAKLARSYGFLNKWDESEEHYLKALELSPKDQRTKTWYNAMLRAKLKHSQRT